jgi:hypothetical protein
VADFQDKVLRYAHVKPASHVKATSSIESSTDGKLRGHLIDARAHMRLNTFHRMRAAQENGSRACVILGAAAVFAFPRSHAGMLQSAHDVHVIAKRLEWLEDFRKLEAGPFSCRSPLVHRRAVRDVNRSHPAFRACGSLPQRSGRRNHRFEKR